MTETYDIYWNSFLPVFFDRMISVSRKNIDKIVAPYGITSAQAIYLFALNIQDGQTLVEISKFLNLDTANTNRVIKMLRERGYIYDDRIGESSKKYHIYLTKEGKKIAEDAMAESSGQMNGYFKGIPEDDVINMRNVLITVLKDIDPSIDEAANHGGMDSYYMHLREIVPDAKK